MKRLIIYALLTGILCSLTFARTQVSDVEAELASLDLKLNESLYGSGDITFLEDILANDWNGRTVGETSYSKAKMMEEIRKAKSELKEKKPPDVRLSVADVKIHIHGDTAVVSGRFRIKLNGEDISPTKYVNVYMKRDGKWRAVATHYFT